MTMGDVYRDSHLLGWGLRRKSWTVSDVGPMYSMEQRRVATEAYIRFGHGCADTMAELGYPSTPPP